MTIVAALTEPPDSGEIGIQHNPAVFVDSCDEWGFVEQKKPPDMGQRPHKSCCHIPSAKISRGQNEQGDSGPLNSNPLGLTVFDVGIFGKCYPAIFPRCLNPNLISIRCTKMIVMDMDSCPSATQSAGDDISAQ